MHTQAQTLLLSPGAEVTALRALLSEWVREPVVVGRLATLLEGPDVRYPCDADAHRLTGWFVPDIDGVDHHLDDPRPVLFDLGGAPAERPHGVTVVELAVAAPPVGALLVRPDGYVAWAADESGPRDATALHHVAVALGSDA
ncbi:hypothetical protein [Pseudonocardia endophytica]|uniref:aromatic-ring hydroxylase C-terminal domain-containing protein n=1 Tax=Pseudonocardia endophytica TaxID=401976 RepID=UPI003C71A9BB